MVLRIIVVVLFVSFGQEVHCISRFSRSEHGKDLPDNPLGNYSTAAVTIDGRPCAQMGLDVLMRNGTAVDAAIAALICNGVHVCHSMGIGGGLIMTHYQRSTRTVDTLIARERAPAAATEDMFHGDPELSQHGGLSIGVPGQILGLYEAKEKFGNPEVTWASLIQPTIDMCKNGITVSPDLAHALQSKKALLLKDQGMRETFINPETDDVWLEGDTFKWPNLANTLERVAQYGAKDFYHGQVAKDLVEDLKELGSIITLEDLQNYKTIWQPSLRVELTGNLVMHSVMPPASGAILAYILNIVKFYEFEPSDLTPLFYHRVTEAYKWAYAQRTKLADPADVNVTDIILEVVRNVTSDSYAFDTFMKIADNMTVNDPNFYGAEFYVPEDYGTTHMGVIAPNGDAVAITSTINQILGSIQVGRRTGILMNDEMDDFSSPNITSGFGIPPSPNNFIKPGKIPLSSTCPTIVIDEATGDVRLVTGASGGTKITSQTASTTIRNLWLGQDLKTAIDAPRFHHQLMPMEVVVENAMAEDNVKGLESRDHRVVLQNGLAVVNAISREKDGRIYAYSDIRKDGSTAGF